MAKTALLRKIKKLIQKNRQTSAPFSGARREFLKRSAVVAASAMPVMQTVALAGSLTKTKNTQSPVIILGAGAAGLAAAYTLKKAGKPFVIFEAANRLGGRIFTEDDFNADKQFIERGGELVDEDHEALIGLAREVGVEIEVFDDSQLEKEIFFIDGRLYTDAQLIENLQPLCDAIARISSEIDAGESGVTYHSAKNASALKYDAMNLKEFLDSLSNSVEVWVKKIIEVAFVIEFGREADQQSAYSLLSVFETDLTKPFEMFGASDESRRVKGGSSRLIEALYKNLGRPQQFMKFQHRLVAIKQKGHKIECTFDGPQGSTAQYSADQVICTMPFGVLRDVEGVFSLDLSPAKKKCIAELGYGHNAKVCLSFSDRFWRQPRGPVPANSGLLYGDFSTQCYWESSRLQKGQRGILTNYLGGDIGYRAGAQSPQVSVNDLSLVYGQATASYEKISRVTNWSQHVCSKGSYACLLPGQYSTIWGAAGEAELNGRLLFAGEHTSLESQGFMNGAYASGILAAKQVR